MKIRSRTAACAGAAACGAALVLAATTPAPAALDPGAEASIDPIDGTFHLEGHGYGHGRGMSQWGAQGAATLGVPYQTILSTYYPGTTLVEGDPDDRIRVLLTADNDGDMRVKPAAKLRAAAGSRGSTELPVTVGKNKEKVSSWRARPVTGGLRLEALTASGWHTYKLYGKALLPSPVKFRTPADQVRIVLPGLVRDYRGQVWAVRDTGATRGLRVVNHVDMEDYLRSVVPSESFPSWAPAALRAQAVAARTYALWKAEATRMRYADICDTTACQVYHGRRTIGSGGTVARDWETPTTDAAVALTAGRRLEYGGKPALTEFSASNGGYSTKGDVPYLVAKADPWDGQVSNAAHAWDATVTAAKVRAAWPSLGVIIALRISERDGNGDWGGRVRSVVITGTGGEKTVSGPAFARAMGLRHPWFHGKPAPGGIVVLPGADSEKSSGRSVNRPAQTQGGQADGRPETEQGGVEVVDGRPSGPVAPEQMQTTPYAPPPR